jgi:hypothetical protein
MVSTLVNPVFLLYDPSFSVPALTGQGASYQLMLTIAGKRALVVEVNVPFNNYITGYSAFHHKAGIHAKAILNAPSTYEIINPEDFGMTRFVHIGSRLTGWNAVRSRVDQLGLPMTDIQVKEVYVLLVPASSFSDC